MRPLSGTQKGQNQEIQWVVHESSILDHIDFLGPSGAVLIYTDSYAASACLPCNT
jgi:hypothetical protein